MTSCERVNNTALQCEHGCCGDNTNQKCCSFQLSETVIIVSCVVGALIVFTLVIFLVLCMTKKKKDAVTPLHPRRRPPRDPGYERRRRVMTEMPKPPPYSEAPPAYNSWNQPTRVTPTVPSRSATEYDQTDQSRSSHARNSRNSPQPSTSGGGALSRISNNRIHTQSDIPISIASRASHVEEIQIRQHHEQDRNYGTRLEQRSRSTHNENYARNTQRSANVTNDTLMTSSNETHHVTRSRVHRSTVPNESNENNHERRSNVHRSTGPIETNTLSSNTYSRGRREINSEELPGGIMHDSPPPPNQAAAVRSAKRRAVLLHLEKRRKTQLELNSSDDESYL